MAKNQIDFKKTIEELKIKHNSQELNGKIICDFINKIISNKKVG